MKNSIKVSALFLLLSTGLFASTAAKANAKEKTSTAEVSFAGAAKALGLNITVAGSTSTKSSVSFYDADNHMLVRDFLKAGAKNYDLSNLETGDYTVKVKTNQGLVTKVIHIL